MLFTAYPVALVSYIRGKKAGIVSWQPCVWMSLERPIALWVNIYIY